MPEYGPGDSKITSLRDEHHRPTLVVPLFDSQWKFVEVAHAVMMRREPEGSKGSTDPLARLATLTIMGITEAPTELQTLDRHAAEAVATVPGRGPSP